MSSDWSALRALARETLEKSELATPGPWHVETQDSDVLGAYITGHVTSPRHTYCGNTRGRRDSITAPDSMTRDDAAWIAHARTAAPQLSRAVEALVRVVEAAAATLPFDISPTFDAKGTYSERKSQEWRALKARLEAQLDAALAEARRVGAP